MVLILASNYIVSRSDARNTNIITVYLAIWMPSGIQFGLAHEGHSTARVGVPGMGCLNGKWSDVRLSKTAFWKSPFHKMSRCVIQGGSDWLGVWHASGNRNYTFCGYCLMQWRFLWRPNCRWRKMLQFIVKKMDVRDGDCMCGVVRCRLYFGELHGVSALAVPTTVSQKQLSASPGFSTLVCWFEAAKGCCAATHCCPVHWNCWSPSPSTIPCEIYVTFIQQFALPALRTDKWPLHKQVMSSLVGSGA